MSLRDASTDGIYPLTFVVTIRLGRVADASVALRIEQYPPHKTGIHAFRGGRFPNRYKTPLDFRQLLGYITS